MNDFELNGIVNLFRSVYDLGRLNNNFEVYNDDTFDYIMSYFAGIMGRDFNEEEIAIIKKRIDSEFQIYQPDGIALLDDYEHESDWYDREKDNIDNFYWKRYRNYLFKKGWQTEVLNSLDFKILNKIMNFLGDPHSSDSFLRKGLVIGDVQSGKTSNYIGLICKAVDAGYKVIVLLTGQIESLRRQTQIRLEEGFIGYDVENKVWVGVGKEEQTTDLVIPKSITSRINDFTGIAGSSTFLKIDNDKVPFIFITKKNKNTLKKIRDSLTHLNIKPPQQTINTSLLVIDDEADNASINTNDPKYDPTTINAEIRKLLVLFYKSTYVGFTATPFANVFIDPDSETEMLKGDLFPKDFIYCLNPPSNYFGAEKIFYNPNYKTTIQLIKDNNDTFPLKHKLTWYGNTMFGSLIEAINAFLLINAIRDLSEGSQKNSHRSMLINVSRFIKVQERFEFLVRDLFDKILNSVKLSMRLSRDQYEKNSYINKLLECYNKHYSNYYNWDEIFSNLFNSIKAIQIYKIPFRDRRRGQLEYEKHEDGLRVIVIGGLALSRGLTLEGLTISYLYRNTATFDVLMQMGRWFGYKDSPLDYSKLCRVWMLESTKEFFKEIVESTKQLKDDIVAMNYSKKAPRDFGIRVRNESEYLRITDRNKMRTSKKYVYTYDLFEHVLETPLISNKELYLKQNMQEVQNFYSKLDFIEVGNSLLSKTIKVEIIVDFLKRIHVHEANTINYFDKERIIEFIRMFNFHVFDVVIIGGDGQKISIHDKDIKASLRSFDFLDDEIIRVGGVHRRLGGPSDTRYGLTDDQVNDVKEKYGLSKLSSKSYLIEDRNPLLLIYPLTLKKPKDYEVDVMENNQTCNLVDHFELLGLIPYGFGIAFPKNEKIEVSPKIVFYVSENTNWWKLMYMKDDEDDD